MHCNEINFNAFVNCDVSDLEAASILDHVQNCQACEDTLVALEQQEKTIGDIVDLQLPSPAADDTDRFFAMLRAAKRVAINARADDRLAELPTQLRDYQLIEKIGEGGMGAVYRALHTRLGKTVAVKVLSPKLCKDPSTVNRFQREMNVIGRMEHSNIVQAYDAGDEQGQHFLVMEYIDGHDLSTLLKARGPFPIRVACELILQAVIGLQHVYEHGLVHRDIKPSNLMLTHGKGPHRSGAVVKILDLGLARLLDTEPVDDSHELTTDGQIMGTIEYMAPEQFDDSHGVDIRADIYALGATFYKLICGLSPYAELAGKPSLQRLSAMASRTIPPLASRVPDVPANIATIVHRMLERNPDDRYQTPAEVVEALRPHSDPDALTSWMRQVDATETESVPLAKLAVDGNLFDRQRWIAYCAGFGAVILLAVILAITTKHGRVEVSSPDGPLPGDLKVVVSQNGNDIQILQAENHWTAKLPPDTGYDLTVRGGDDQFEIKDSKLVINRFGKTICVVSRVPSDLREPTAPSIVSVVDSNTANPYPTDKSEVVLQDRENPFVLIDRSGNVLKEFPSINHALAVPTDEILEIHGNGPFKLQQVIRSGGSLNIRAAKGYMPRIEAGFVLPENDNGCALFSLTNVNVNISGCEFRGMTHDQFLLFAGSGDKWNFDRCRLLQPNTRVGGPIRFEGGALQANDCHFYSPSPTTTLLSLTKVHNVELINNRFVGDGPAVVFAPSTDMQILFDANVFHCGAVLYCGGDAEKANATRVRAVNNRFIQRGALVSGFGDDLSSRLTWQGSRNTFAARSSQPLWTGERKESPPMLKTAAEWNAYWKSDQDLIIDPLLPITWNPLFDRDLNRAKQVMEKEIVDARRKYGSLDQLGPEVGRIAEITGHRAKFPAVADGGPFVVVRAGQPLAAFISFDTALLQTKDGDVIEVYSDGPFPRAMVQFGWPNRGTLRAASGYRPVFEGFDVHEKNGAWSLEGLHFRPEENSQGPLIWGPVERVMNCSVEPSDVDGRIHMRNDKPDAKQTVIENCWFPNHIEVFASHCTITNSVIGTMDFVRPEPGIAPELRFEKCVIWSSTNYPVSFGFHSAILENCLIDAPGVTIPNESRSWLGKRNLYRFFGAFDFSAKSDEGSFTDDSFLQSKAAWQVNSN